MTSPGWWSQPFPPTGAITSEGIRNQLGRPPVDPLTIFVRETVQNSWDARLGGGPVTYELELSRVSPARRPDWQRLLAPPAEVAAHLPLGRLLRRPDLTVLSVIDRGTGGLGGPTRADRAAEHRRDWVSFVLNVGEKRDTAQGGGTYGYGKAVLYRLSRAGTVLVYSRVRGDRGPSSRLVGIALGDSFETSEHRGSRPFTGRHWWGHIQQEHVEPLLDDEADAVARQLGLRGFEDSETGTTLAVVAPGLEEFDREDGSTSVGSHLAETISWHAWPLMLPDRGAERLVPRVSVHGAAVPVPDPATTYPLKMFAAAYRRATGSDGEPVMCGAPRRRLGAFALERRVVLPMTEAERTNAAAYADVPGDPHHVCLMRSPELVVRYFEGPKPFSTNIAYAGVFRAADDLDEVFAAAEPPTHDNWVFEQLEGDERTFVRVVFRRLKERLAEFRRSAIETPVRSGVPLGAVSNYLGGLVAAAYATDTGGPSGDHGRGHAGDGDGRGSSRDHGRGLPAGGSAARGDGDIDAGPAESDDRSLSRNPGPGRAGVVRTGSSRLGELDGEAVILQTVFVTGDQPVELFVRLAVITAVGKEDEPPAGLEVPTVHSWRTPEAVTTDERCVVRGPAEVELRVRPVPDTLIDIRVTGRVPGSGS